MQIANRSCRFLAGSRSREIHRLQRTKLLVALCFLVVGTSAEAGGCNVSMSPSTFDVPLGDPVTVKGSFDDPPDDGSQYSWVGYLTMDGVEVCSFSVRQYSNGIDTERDCSETINNLSAGVHTLGWSCTGSPTPGSQQFLVGTLGYVDPKYVVVGVTYAPPGQSTNTFVQYTNSTFVGNTQSLSNSFESSTNVTVSVSAGLSIPGVQSGTITATSSTVMSQTVKNTSTLTTSVQVQDGEKTYGTGNYYAPVDNDYDQIWVWLNPAAVFFVGGNAVRWQGYAFDLNDPAGGMDIVPIPLGYLNGDFGPMPPDIQGSLNRAWSASQTWPAGEGPALTSADLAQIASADPFSNSSYGPSNIGSDPPTTETPDHRFTLSMCSQDSGFNYLQAAPSSIADIYTCTLTYSSTSTQAQDITSSFAQTFSVDASLKNSVFLAGLDAELKVSNTLTWTTDEQSSVTTSNTSTASLSVQGPPCGATAPCSPLYDGAGNQPTEFVVYQDNMYGTFMFAPVDYYPIVPSGSAN